MDIKFSKDDGGSPQQGGTGEKGNQNVLLIVLLILVAGFGYIYFFTGLIKPAQEQKVAEAPPAASQVVKKPLPSADGEPAKADAGGSETKKDAIPAVKPEPVKPAPAPAPVAAAKPAKQETAKPKEDLKKVEVAEPAVRKPMPVVGKAGEKKPEPIEKKQPAVAEKKPAVAEKKPAVVEKKPVVAEKKPLPSKDSEKKSAVAKKPVEKSTAVASGTVAASGRWTVLVGNYLLEEAMATDLGRVRSAGVEAFVVPGVQKKTNMNRLMLAEYTDRASAQAELSKLKKYTSDAFVIDNAGMHTVYAGSYLLDARASSEKERLAAAGFSLTLKRAAISIPTKNLTAGSFVEKSAAEDVLKKLRTAGVKATLSR
jgi:cell division septation protein DedD